LTEQPCSHVPFQQQPQYQQQYQQQQQQQYQQPPSYQQQSQPFSLQQQQQLQQLIQQQHLQLPPLPSNSSPPVQKQLSLPPSTPFPESKDYLSQSQYPV
jgi:hypothetical protein